MKACSFLFIQFCLSNHQTAKSGKLLFCAQMKQLFSFCFLLIATSSLNAQPVKSMSNSEILWELQNLNNTGSALYLAAHPDDENTRLISYLANERHIRTAYLSLTRGDGGQNLIGSEKGPLLGMIRTQELLAARRTDHGTQYFSRAYDFGYSKNPEETFHFWNKDSVLADAVWVIRTFKPDVIICRFPATGEGGHGHHTASAIIAEEAFTAAADPTKFPRQLKYTSTWQAKRLVWNTFNFGGNNTTSPDQLKIDVGGFNPLLGKYNGEIAAESRSMHKSQGFGSEKSRGSQWEYFKHIKGEKAASDLFDGMDISWNRFAQTKKLSKMIDNLIVNYDLTFKEDYLRQLMTVYTAFKELQTNDEALLLQKDLKIKTLEKIVLAYCGMWIDVTTNVATAAPRQEITVKYSLLSSSKQPVTIRHIHIAGKDTTPGISLSKNEMQAFTQTVHIPKEVSYSSPYWLYPLPEKGLFQVNDIFKNTLAEDTPALSAAISLKILSEEYSLKIPVRYKTVDPVKGEIYQPLQIFPEVAVNVPYKNYLFTDTVTKTIPVTVQCFTDSFDGKLAITPPKGWSVYPQHIQVSLKSKGATVVVPIQLRGTKDAGETKEGTLQFSVLSGQKLFNKSITTIQYDHIPNQALIQPATAHLVYEPMITPKKKIGYIPGAGDEVADLLKEMNMDVTIISDEQLASASLDQYDAIITGVRAYNINEKLQNLHGKMMSYVEQGGNLIVQYNTNSRVGPLKADIGPYPFAITRDRVTDETAAVTFLQPEHPAFNTPNKITQKDFDGWIQERGIYFAADLDEHYQPLLRMNDPGETPNDGSLIIAPYGKGNFVYTGLVFFRELPAGVPGAYKLFLNLLTLPKNK